MFFVLLHSRPKVLESRCFRKLTAPHPVPSTTTRVFCRPEAAAGGGRNGVVGEGCAGTQPACGTLQPFYPRNQPSAAAFNFSGGASQPAGPPLYSCAPAAQAPTPAATASHRRLAARARSAAAAAAAAEPPWVAATRAAAVPTPRPAAAVRSNCPRQEASLFIARISAGVSKEGSGALWRWLDEPISAQTGSMLLRGLSRHRRMLSTCSGCFSPDSFIYKCIWALSMLVSRIKCGS